ncbi:MAG: hypothetical protein K9K88_00585 [Desulfobacterales bacterium]|nr:hypothetical protein [Desulfobacterales bacterium]
MWQEDRVRGFQAGKKNAPSFIYEILTGIKTSLKGREANHEQKIWQGIAVDKHIPTKALDDLSRIEEIEIRSSCEGSGPERPTFLIFRFKNPVDADMIDKFVLAMNSIEETCCGAEVGNMGFYRVGVTASLWYEKDTEKFVQWWLELPTKIHVVLAVLLTVEDI